MSSSPFNPEDEEEEHVEKEAAFDPDAPLPPDFETLLLKRLVQRLLSRLSDPRVDIPVSEMELIRKLASDNSVSFASIRAGNFGDVARQAAEEFPFDEQGNVIPLAGRP